MMSMGVCGRLVAPKSCACVLIISGTCHLTWENGLCRCNADKNLEMGTNEPQIQ